MQNNKRRWSRRAFQHAQTAVWITGIAFPLSSVITMTGLVDLGGPAVLAGWVLVASLFFETVFLLDRGKMKPMFRKLAWLLFVLIVVCSFGVWYAWYS